MSKIIRWIIQLFSSYPGKSFKRTRRALIGPPLIGTRNVGTFDGAAQNGKCGGGGTLRIAGGKNYIFKIGLGEGTNNRAELLSLWALIWLAIHVECRDVTILGDSKAIIDWINGKAAIRNSTLLHWYQKICQLKELFEQISFQHIYREHNSKADLLSKEALNLGDGILLMKIEEVGAVHSWEQHTIY